MKQPTTACASLITHSCPVCTSSLERSKSVCNGGVGAAPLLRTEVPPFQGQGARGGVHTRDLDPSHVLLVQSAQRLGVRAYARKEAEIPLSTSALGRDLAQHVLGRGPGGHVRPSCSDLDVSRTFGGLSRGIYALRISGVGQGAPAAPPAVRAGTGGGEYVGEHRAQDGLHGSAANALQDVCEHT